MSEQEWDVLVKSSHIVSKDKKMRGYQLGKNIITRR